MAGDDERSGEADTSVRTFSCSAEGCSTETREGELIRGSYCSLRCFHRSEGRDILRNIKHDHRFCSSCFRVRKEIDYPPESFIAERSKLVGEAMIGEEELTPQMTTESGLVYCTCGTIDHDAEEKTLRHLDREEAVANLWSLLQQFAEESQVAAVPSREPFDRELAESGEVAVAIGAAIYD